MKGYYWKQLLMDWRKQGRDGLTIPYIIGSQKYLGYRHWHTIRELVEDIASNNKTEIYLTYCPTINDLILAIRDETKSRLRLNNVSYLNQDSQLFISPFLDGIDNNVESVIEFLTERYQIYIDEGGFSLNDGERTDFTADEVIFITTSFRDLLK